MERAYSRFISVFQLPSDLQRFAQNTGRVWRELEGKEVGFGTVNVVRIPGKPGVYLLAAHHSFEKNPPHDRIPTSREVEFSPSERLLVTAEMLAQNPDELTKLGILAIEVTGPEFIERAIELNPGLERGSFRVGTRIAEIGYPNYYLKDQSLRGPVVSPVVSWSVISLGEVRRPTWDLPGFLTTNARIGKPYEWGFSGGFVINGQGQVGGVIVIGEVMLDYTESRKANDKIAISQARHIRQILAYL